MPVILRFNKQVRQHYTVRFGIMNLEIQIVAVVFMASQSHSNDLNFVVHDIKTHRACSATFKAAPHGGLWSHEP